MLRSTLLAASCGLFLVACGGSNKPETQEPAETSPAGGDEEAATAGADGAQPGELTADDRQVLDRMVALTIELVEELNKAGEDCDAMAGSLDSFADERGDEYRQLTGHFEDAPEQTQQQIQEEMQVAVGPKMEELMPGMLACQEHEGVRNGFERLQAL